MDDDAGRKLVAISISFLSDLGPERYRTAPGRRGARTAANRATGPGLISPGLHGAFALSALDLVERLTFPVLVKIRGGFTERRGRFELV